ncbi:hypothetical protein [Streptomyces erythrochromogenes]|uniref:hypothetical protein n=1 Tax=Streptomyces erythrochromogenes TaxID=285574 RepID=UPI0036B81BB5
MIVRFLHAKGLRSEHANSIACLTIGLSVASWLTSAKVERAGIDRADRWGIFVATWPATWFGLGQALARYEDSDELHGYEVTDEEDLRPT